MALGSNTFGTVDPKPARWVPPNAEQAMILGHCQVDGGLHWSFALGFIDLGGGLRLSLQLIHGLEISSERKARSVWRVSGLRTFIAPSDRTHLLWLSPTSVRIEINRQNVGPHFTSIGHGSWEIRELGPGNWDLKDSDRGIWCYRHGALKEVVMASGYHVRVESHGGCIDSFRVDRDAKVLHAVTANYDACGRIIGIICSGVSHRFSYNGRTDALVEWTEQEQGKPVAVTSFSYSDGLLEEIHPAAGVIIPFRWATVKDARRADQLWPLPVQLIEDDRFIYEHQLRQEGFVLIAYPKLAGPTEETVFNPRRGRIVRRRDGQTIDVLTIGIRVGQRDLGRVNTVEDGAGRVIQRLFYSNGGLLERLELPQEPGGLPILFSYDKMGHMTAATRGGKPWEH
jgi:hypothetical protein